ncbi:MAG TPA: MerR family transcriptional regulator [Thermoanaerobaculia bacterium]|nr:MerR family transcriptional regulator [Thermoanaerobaculia bacterium]
MVAPRRRRSLGLSIAEVSRRTGISASTLRFYEREMPGLFLIRKTAGGHRRYREEDVERFAAIRRLTEEESLPLAQVRRVLSSRGDHEPLREEVERLRAAREEDGWRVAELGRRVSALEEKLAQLERALSGKRRWFDKKPFGRNP